MVHTVGLVLHPQRDSLPAIETIINWATARKVTVLGLPDEVGRIDCSAEACGKQVIRAESGPRLDQAGLIRAVYRHIQGGLGIQAVLFR